MLDSFPFYNQLEESDCGPTCLRMIAKHFGKAIPMKTIKDSCPIELGGVTLKGLSYAAEAIHFRPHGVKIPFEGSVDEGGLLDIDLPCIAFWGLKHYVVIYKIKNNKVWVADPALGKVTYSKQEFERSWLVEKDKGILLLLEPKPEFYDQEIATEKDETQRFLNFYNYLRPHRRLIIQLMMGLSVSSIFALIFPFMTQSLVDKGIVYHDLELIYAILAGQIVLFLSSTFVSVMQSWIFLHIGVRISIELIHDFLIKLMKLPVSFFNRRTVGDILQRIGDHERINSFITSSTVSVLFSIVNLVVFSFILAIYHLQLFVIYWISSILYIGWILVFLKPKRILDYKSFEFAAANQSKLIEIIEGIQEIKLQNSQWKRRSQWLNLQAKIFKLRTRGLRLSQFQSVGAGFINQFRNIIISFLAAKAVMDGDLSLGMMLAIQYIIGQINAPLESMIGFVQSAQSAKIGYERLSEINTHDEEETTDELKSSYVPDTGDIVLDKLHFRYAIDRPEVLEDINIRIRRNKVTAIVGSSGSGKTTLIKILLGFYRPTSGRVFVGDADLNGIRLLTWRGRCGAVMQDGFIFPDTVAHNICESDTQIDNQRLYVAARAANADEFIRGLHAGFNTAIGEHGLTLSQGQKQRLLIARAIYKSPDFLFFDEATNSLDATNELEIMRNLEEFYQGRTVVVVAHRLSSVKHADHIVVLDKGKVVEEGTHDELVSARSYYYNLVSNQLELQS